MRDTLPRVSFRTVRLIAAVLAVTGSICSARTILDSSPAEQGAAVDNVFHREFDGSAVTSADHLVLLITAADGAVVSINGHEIGRFGLPSGSVTASTVAEVPASKDKGVYRRIRISPEFITAGKNIIDADVHSSVAAGSTLTCDLEVKTLPTMLTQPPADDAAKSVLELFRKTSYLPAGTLIPDGYIDGGHGSRLDAADHATSSREILVVDRPMDAELTKELKYADSVRGLDPIERAHKLSLYVDQCMTPLGGRSALGDTVDELQEEFKNEPLCIGDVVDQAHAGVCRHRSLLFKVLADEAGLKTALVRGNYFHAGKGMPHAWNEIVLDDGRRFLVDVTQHPKDEFAEITNADVTPATVAKHYVKLDNSPYYQSSKS